MPTHSPARARPAHSIATFCDALCTRLPVIHSTQAICNDPLRDIRSASTAEASDPASDPAGIEAVMNPCVYEAGWPKKRFTPDMDEMSKPKSMPPCAIPKSS
ncbi:hypothetical protein L249_2559 [Ophiocordyceps polyrhachis-furcata BCC 54312]|uniref:Uncharacterized protein n=1 Tax=Ophiocordyceps polyrhachis-furcata BCC 54312 TaxID=1330021 RepID=A0A367LQF6_9HYPO|nr:hypothetical protein L249_2559 [Ophiocordyceps polyrhachis-furcata BCC 54312]